MGKILGVILVCAALLFGGPNNGMNDFGTDCKCFPIAADTSGIIVHVYSQLGIVSVDTVMVIWNCYACRLVVLTRKNKMSAFWGSPDYTVVPIKMLSGDPYKGNKKQKGKKSDCTDDEYIRRIFQTEDQ